VRELRAFNFVYEPPGRTSRRKAFGTYALLFAGSQNGFDVTSYCASGPRRDDPGGRLRVGRRAAKHARHRRVRASRQLTARAARHRGTLARHDSGPSRSPGSPPTLCPARTRRRAVPGCRAAVAACLAPLGTQVVPLASQLAPLAWQVAPLASQVVPLASQLDAVLVQRDVTRCATCCHSPNTVMSSRAQCVSPGVHHASVTVQRDATACTSRCHQGNRLLRTLVQRPANLVTRAAKAVTRPAKALTRAANAVTRTANVVTRSANAVTRLASAVTRLANAVTRPAKAVTRPAKAVTRAVKAMTECCQQGGSFRTRGAATREHRRCVQTVRRRPAESPRTLPRIPCRRRPVVRSLATSHGRDVAGRSPPTRPV